MPNRKLGKASDQRDAMLRNLTTALMSAATPSLSALCLWA